MRVKALRTFVSRMNGQTFRVEAGDLLEMPTGADWLQAGLVTAVTNTPENASLTAPERSVTKKSRARQAK